MIIAIIKTKIPFIFYIQQQVWDSYKNKIEIREWNKYYYENET